MDGADAFFAGEGGVGELEVAGSLRGVEAVADGAVGGEGGAALEVRFDQLRLRAEEREPGGAGVGGLAELALPAEEVGAVGIVVVVGVGVGIGSERALPDGEVGGVDSARVVEVGRGRRGGADVLGVEIARLPARGIERAAGAGDG